MGNPGVILLSVIKILIIAIIFMGGVAFFTLTERKVLRIIINRLGPNKTRVAGILQPISDAIKLSNKTFPRFSFFSPFFYLLSSIFSLIIVLILVSSVPSVSMNLEIKYPILLVFLILSLNSLNLIYLGWNRNGKYSILGSIRTVSLLITYECVIFIILFFTIYRTKTYVIKDLALFNLIFFIPWVFYLWVPSILIETNRSPFDFSEAERELVRGYNVDYGSVTFTIIFLTEYSSIIFMSIFSRLIFFPSITFTFLIILGILWVRRALPRHRYDKLLKERWTFVIPFVTVIFIEFLLLTSL